VCSFIGAQQVQIKPVNGRNPLVDLARSIDILGAVSAEEQALRDLRGEPVAASLEEDPRFGRTAADPDKGVEADNSQGSFEAFLSAFGAPPEASTADAAEGG
jgi:hypothetical protein